MVPSDPEVSQALKHPIRRRLVPIFIAHRALSPREAARILPAPLPSVSYHVRVLVKVHFLVLRNQEAVRGATKSYYEPNKEILNLPVVRELLEGDQAE